MEEIMDNASQQPFDFNEKSSSVNDEGLIPEGTVAHVKISIIPGGEGPDGQLTQSKTSDVIMLCFMATILSGAYAHYNFWFNIMLDGGKRDINGYSQCGQIGRKQIRAILESARNIRPDDMSESALAARRITGWADLDGLTFWAVIGIEKDKKGMYPDKNRIKRILTPAWKAMAESRHRQPMPRPFSKRLPWSRNRHHPMTAHSP